MKCLICLFLLFSTGLLYAQKVKDNPYHALESVDTDYAGLKAFDILTLDLSMHNPTEVLNNIEYILQLAKKRDEKTFICVYYETLANYHSMRYDRINDLSSRYHEQALEVAQNNDLKAEIFRQNFNIGNYYYTYARLGNAYAYFRAAMESAETVGTKNIAYIWKYYLTLSRYFYDIEEYDLSSKTLEQILANNDQLKPREFYNSLTILGLVNLRTNQLDEALDNFQQVYVKSTERLDSAWMGIAKGNIGNVYLQKGELEEAIANYQIDYEYNTKDFGDIISALGSLKKIAELRFELGQFKQSMTDINTYIGRIEKKPARYKDISEAYALKIRLLDTLGLKDQELAAVKKFNKYNSLHLSLGNKVSIELLKLKEEQQKFQNRISSQEASVSYGGNIYSILFLSIITAGLIFGGWLLYNTRKSKKEEIPSIQEERVNQDVYDIRMIIADKRFHVSEHEKTKHISLELREVMELNLMNPKNWDRFKYLYNANFPKFFEKLTNQYPDLTDSELRLLALMNLHLSNNELAEKLSVSLEGVKKAKQRLKKKINSYHYSVG